MENPGKATAVIANEPAIFRDASSAQLTLLQENQPPQKGWRTRGQAAVRNQCGGNQQTSRGSAPVRRLNHEPKSNLDAYRLAVRVPIGIAWCTGSILCRHHQRSYAAGLPPPIKRAQVETRSFSCYLMLRVSSVRASWPMAIQPDEKNMRVAMGQLPRQYGGRRVQTCGDDANDGARKGSAAGAAGGCWRDDNDPDLDGKSAQPLDGASLSTGQARRNSLTTVLTLPVPPGESDQPRSGAVGRR